MNAANLKLRIHHFVFSAYYKRVPEFFRQWPILKSLSLLVQNYEHQRALYAEQEKVIDFAISNERAMQSRISSLELRLAGVSQEDIGPINKMFGTDLKGVSKLERDN